MQSTKETKLKEAKKALRRMPNIWKCSETEYHDEMRFANKIFGRTIKEILKYRLTK